MSVMGGGGGGGTGQLHHEYSAHCKQAYPFRLQFNMDSYDNNINVSCDDDWCKKSCKNLHVFFICSKSVVKIILCLITSTCTGFELSNTKCILASDKACTFMQVEMVHAKSCVISKGQHNKTLNSKYDTIPP